MALCVPAPAAVSYLLGSPKAQFFDNNGVPLVGGKLYSYKVGGSTDKSTYSNAALTSANTNPVTLDARGEAVVYLSGATKLVLKDAHGVTIWTFPSAGGLSSSTELNVKDYGATGLGVVDDGLAIIAAAADLSNTGIKRIVFPSGTYKIYSVGTTYANLVDVSAIDGLQIVSQGATLAIDPLRTFTSQYGSIFKIANCHNVLIDGFNVTGPIFACNRRENRFTLSGLSRAAPISICLTTRCRALFPGLQRPGYTMTRIVISAATSTSA